MRFPHACLLLLACVLRAHPAGAAAEAPADPLAGEIARLEAELAVEAAGDKLWADIRGAATPALADARQALAAGLRLLALERTLQARSNLAAAAYVRARPAEERQALPGLEAEWRRMQGVLRTEAPTPATLAEARPAIARALGEVALGEVGVYFAASLDYGRNTQPESGFYYLGVALAQQQAAALARELSAPVPLAAPALRSLGAELDALQAELLAAYRPPASIDRHSEFIVASAALKEGLELDAAGLYHGALLRYLQSAQRVAMLRGVGATAPADAVEERLRKHDERLTSGAVDHSIGRLFVERARGEQAKATPAGAAAAAAIAEDVLPRYFAALAPAPPRPSVPAPRVTVTLVRWPYT